MRITTPQARFRATGYPRGHSERAYWNERTLRVALGVLAVAYLAAVSTQLVAHGGWPTPDFLIPPLLLLAVASKRGWAFLIDWLPLLALVLVYEGFRGMADDLNHRVHYISLIRADEWFFGKGRAGPDVLQAHLYHPGRVSWYDWAACAAYSAHYVLPMALGFALWLKARRLYWRFATSFLLLFLAGFVAFYLYPAAPPWMAAQDGLIPPMQRILVDTLSTLPATQPFALAYQRFSPNLVAAMPSLHAASPMLLALISVRVWGRKATPLLAYPLIAGMAWVYMGEHYFIDVLIGWLFGIAAFALVWGVTFPRLASVAEAAGRRLPAGLRMGQPLPSWPLALVALGAMAYVWVDPLIRAPFDPYAGFNWVTAVPAQAAEPAQPAPPATLVAAVPCDSEPGAASTVDDLLAPLAPQYSAYVVGLSAPSCFSITAEAVIPPPGGADVEELQADSALSSDPTVLSLADDEPGYVTVVRAGMPSPSFQQTAGVDPESTYALVIRADGAESENGLIEVARTVGETPLGP